MTERSPAGLRHRLAAEMVQLRGKRTLKWLVEQTGVSETTIRRVEKARGHRPNRSNMLALLKTLDAPAAKRAYIMSLWEGAGSEGATAEYPNLREPYRVYVENERVARGLRNYQSLFIPGLMQTEPYARAVIGELWPDAKPADVQEHVKVRLNRQALLTKDDPLHLDVVVDEAALRRCVGGPLVMAEQMRRLKALAELPHVSLQVIPFSVGVHGGMHGNFAVLSFDDADHAEFVYIENMGGNDQFLHKKPDVNRYTSTFENLRKEKALSPDASLTLIDSVQRELTAQGDTR